MKISLVVGTFGRKVELSRFLKSLTLQSFKNFEVIVVDQNPVGFLDDLIKEYNHSLEILLIRSEIGFSAAKNRGIEASRGEVVAFPDDDCWYKEGVLEEIQMMFNTIECDVICGRTIDEEGNLVLSKYDTTSGFTNLKNVWYRVGSQTMFIKRHVFDKIGLHDESLGVGAQTAWLSCEDTDLIIRAIRAGIKVFYDPKIEIFHPNVLVFDESIIARASKYSPGVGYVLGKHGYSFLFIIKVIHRPAIGGAYFWLLRNRIKSIYYRNIVKGILSGWLKGRVNAW